MKKKLLLICLSQLLPLTGFSQQKPMRLWFSQPAYQPAVFSYKAPEFTNTFRFEKRGWVEALPVGNGRLGAMVLAGCCTNGFNSTKKVCGMATVEIQITPVRVGHCPTYSG